MKKKIVLVYILAIGIFTLGVISGEIFKANSIPIFYNIKIFCLLVAALFAILYSIIVLVLKKKYTEIIKADYDERDNIISGKVSNTVLKILSLVISVLGLVNSTIDVNLSIALPIVVLSTIILYSILFWVYDRKE